MGRYVIIIFIIISVILIGFIGVITVQELISPHIEKTIIIKNISQGGIIITDQNEHKYLFSESLVDILNPHDLSIINHTYNITYYCDLFNERTITGMQDNDPIVTSTRNNFTDPSLKCIEVNGRCE
jgi:hypothetical protein